MSLQLASFFSGVGGIDLAFQRAGVPSLLTCEIDRAAASVLRRHFPDAAHHDDITKVTADDLYAAGLDPSRAVLAGGFPCQDLSVAGARRGMGEGTRSGLYWHLDRLMGEFHPAWVVLENVPGLLSSHGGRDMGAVVGSLADRGYGWSYRVLDAQHFGVPQRRRRVVIVGRLGDSGSAPAQVLLEPEGSRRDSAPGQSAGAVAAGGSAQGASSLGVVGTLTSSAQGGWRVGADGAAAGHLVATTYQKVIRSGARDKEGNLPPEVWAARKVAATLNLNDLGSESRSVELVVESVTGARSHALTAEGADASEDGTGRGTPIIAATLTAGTSSPNVSAPGRRQEDDVNIVACVPSSLAATRYDWTYGERAEARPGEVLRLLRETVGEEEVAEWLTGVVASLLPPEVLRPPVHGEGLRPSAGDYRSVVDDGTPPRPEGGPSRPVRDLRKAGRERCAPPQWQLAGQLARELDEALSQLPPEGTSRRDALLGLWRAAQGAGLLRQALPEVQDDRGPAGDAHARAEDVQRLWGTSALTVTLREALHAGEAGGHSPDDLTGGAGVTTVRRLTPLLLECERLQGHPDNWTKVATRPDGTTHEQSDTQRYRQMGNGVAVPVFEWVARRLVAVDARARSEVAA